MRPGWLPEKQAQRKRRLERSDSKNKEVVSSSESSDISQPKQKARRRNRTISTELESEKEFAHKENDSGIGTFSSQQSSQDSIIKMDTSKEEENSTSSENSFVPSLMQNSPTLETYRTLLNYQSTKSSISTKQTSAESSASVISPQNIINHAASPLGQNSDNRSLSHISADTADSNLKNDPSESLAVFPTADVSNNPEQKSSLCSTSSTAGVNDSLEENRFSSTTSESTAVVDYCIICLKRPKTGSIIHGCTGHQVCCFRCARRLKRRGRPCPVCRRPIQKVIRNFIL
jgi:E3 ubiquitin-protein ligase Mdm2